MEKDNIFRNTNRELTAEDINMLSPLQLAYVGDAVYELLVRTYLLSKRFSVHELHNEAIKYVRAEAQADIVHKLLDTLTEEELSIVKRGRNAKTGTMPKNASMIDYKYATGFESLIGYLYLKGQDVRIEELFQKVEELDIN